MPLMRPSALLSFILLSAWSLIVAPSAHAQACPDDGSYSYSITGTGASTLGPFFTSLVFGYRDLSKDTCPSYLISSSGSGRSAIVSKKVRTIVDDKYILVENVTHQSFAATSPISSLRAPG
jgi:hypothetical protein